MTFSSAHALTISARASLVSMRTTEYQSMTAATSNVYVVIESELHRSKTQFL